MALVPFVAQAARVEGVAALAERHGDVDIPLCARFRVQHFAADDHQLGGPFGCASEQVTDVAPGAPSPAHIVPGDEPPRPESAHLERQVESASAAATATPRRCSRRARR